MKRRILVMLLLLAACAEGPSGPSDDNNPPAVGTTRATAAPIGMAVETTVSGEFIWGNGRIRLTVLSIERGATANEKVSGWNRFNTEPGAGREYLLARIRVEVLELHGEEPLEINRSRWSVVRADGVVYPSHPIVTGNPEPLSVEMYSGSHTGVQPFVVDIGDTPTLAFERREHYARWFRLH